MSRKNYLITEPEQLKCLASAVRQEIVDTVQSLGECSIADIATALGRPADGLYYHVRELLKAGLLLKHGTARNNRREEAIYTTPARDGSLQLRYELGDPVARKRIRRIVDSMLHTAARDFADGFESGLATVEGRHRNLWAGRTKGWLDMDDLREVNELLERLSELMDRSRSPERRNLLVLSWALAPVVAQPLRRD
jgi:DNA-binding Lrp family transcriptional regulator